MLIGRPGRRGTLTWSSIIVNYDWNVIMVEIVYFKFFKLLHASSSEFTTKTHQPKCK